MKKQWRCFFCDEVFTDRNKAAQHFGAFEACEADEVACKLLPYQEKVLKYIRDLENQVRELQAQVHTESHPLLEALYEVQHEAESRVSAANNKGYAKGVADMKSQGYCVEPAKHDYP